MPTVRSGRLYQVEKEHVPIDVGTPSWYDWLENHSLFIFVDHVGAVTVLKNGTDRSESEWKASRTRIARDFTVSLGPSHTLTLSNMQAAARRLLGKHVHARTNTPFVNGHTASKVPAPRQESRQALWALSCALNSTAHAVPVTLSPGPDSSSVCMRHSAARSPSVCAPAGFGKTTLLTQWLQTTDRAHAWLSLDDHDNELPVFVQSLTASLQTAFPDAFAATAALLKTPRILQPDQIVPLLINDLADVPHDIILVLDDYHVIHNREIHTLLESLVEHLPPQLHLVLICRSDPPLPVARWLAKGRLYELRGTDLRFLPEETEAFLTPSAGKRSGTRNSRYTRRTDGGLDCGTASGSDLVGWYF